jgi:glycogen operon protein
VARGPKQLSLILFGDDGGAPRVLALDARHDRRGDVWERFVPGVGAGQRYAWAVDPRRPLLDPSAVAVAGPTRFGQDGDPSAGRRDLKSVVVAPPEPVTWRRPNHALADSVIYEVHARGFTRHPSSGAAAAGTYRGLVDRIDHLKSLGVTAVELLPVHEFDERENHRAGLFNFWGYSPLAWSAPNRRYASDGATADGPIREFREMVQALHGAGIEVILDLVFNHTGEQGRPGPVWHFKDLDPEGAYLRDDDGGLMDLTGCGNTVRCADPWMRRMIVDSLRWWVHGLGVDGFRFDLTTIFTRDDAGALDTAAAIVRDIESDPWLQGVHLIAEPWDAAGGHLVADWPGNDVWAVWNDTFRDDVRRAWLEEDHAGGALAKRLTGSSDKFDVGPARGVNFVTAHDGFTLADVVSYEDKHNESNGEHGNDGRDGEPSANFGVEGPTDDAEIRIARNAARRNLMATTLLAQGVPMIVAGDEMGRTQRGNNNAYCHDDEISWLDWQGVERDAEFLRFVRGVIGIRREARMLRRQRFLADNEVTWFGADGEEVDWHDAPGQFAYRLHGTTFAEPDLIVLINLDSETCGFDLPSETTWALRVDTAAPPPEDYHDAETAPHIDEAHIVLSPRSLVLLRQA